MEAHSFARSDGGLTLPRSRKLLGAFSDERLVTQLRRGNDAAFEVLYDRHHAAVLSYCRHMLGSRDEAEDALQQAFVSAHADIVSSEKPIRFKAWIYTIARNRCLSILRARREQPTADLERVSTAGLSDEVQHRAELQELLADMQELPEDQRTALILSELGDLSHAEVADVIDCEVSKVKSLVFQARSGLIERKQAREVPCAEIREQLATLRGGSLRRGPLRRHLKACPGCAEFRLDVRRQRQMVAAVLPVVPTLGLRESALASVGVGASSAGAGVFAGGGAGAVLAAKAGVAKVAVIAVATTGAAGGAVAVQQTVTDDGSDRGAKQHQSDGAAGGAGSNSAADVPGARGLEADDTGSSGGALDNARNGDARENGFMPITGESNGERARDFADGRGNGQQHGLDKQPPAGGNVNANAGVKGPKPRQQPAARGPATPEKPAQAGSPDPNANADKKPGLTDLLPTLTPPTDRREQPDGRGSKDENAQEPDGLFGAR